MIKTLIKVGTMDRRGEKVIESINVRNVKFTKLGP